MSRSVVVVVLALVSAASVTESTLLSTNVPFFSWVDTDTVLQGLSPSADELTEESFLELTAESTTNAHLSLDQEDIEQSEDLISSALGQKACDPEFNCSKYKDNTASVGAKSKYYQPKRQQDVNFPLGHVPRQARCYLSCDYQSSFYHKTEDHVDANADVDANVRSTSALARAATTFLETSSTSGTRGGDDDAINTEFLGSPFHCKTKCTFKEPMFCNPVRRMLIGATGHTPHEHSCCRHCETFCKRPHLDKFRMCLHGCQALCPFVSQVKYTEKIKKLTTPP